MITKKNRGAGLLRNSEALDKILEGIFSRISSGFSIKTRIGFENPDEILELIKVFNRYPLSEIIIHPRVARQMYSGRASVDVFREIMNLSDHQLVYNGDICSVDVFREISSKLAGINRWMIGRAAISNPFLPEMIKNGEGFPEDAPERFFRFHDALYDSFRQKFHGPAHLLDRMKAFWRYFHLSFSNGRDIQKRINKIRTEADYLEAVNSLKSKEPNLVEIKSPLMMDL